MCVAIVPGGLSDKRGPAGRRRSGAQADKGQLCASGPSSDPCPALVSVAGPERHRGPGARLAESGSLVGTEAWPARHGQPQSPGLGPPHCLLLPGRGALPPSPWPRIPFPGSEAVEDTGVRPSRAFWGPGSRHGQGSPKTPGAGLVPEHPQGRPPWTPPVMCELRGRRAAASLPRCGRTNQGHSEGRSAVAFRGVRFRLRQEWPRCALAWPGWLLSPV